MGRIMDLSSIISTLGTVRPKDSEAVPRCVSETRKATEINCTAKPKSPYMTITTEGQEWRKIVC